MRPKRLQRLQNALDKRIGSLAVVLEAVYLRHNLSAVLRTAEAFGIQDIHLVSAGQPIEHGVARGAEKWVSLHVYSSIDECITTLKQAGFALYAADLNPKAYTPETLPIHQKTAILFGTELAGISETARQLADGFIVIPMVGLTQSLNVSVAAACILSRLSTRHREAIGGGDLSAVRKSDLLNFWQQRER